MGKYYGGPNSPYYGKVGAVVARKWRTENVVSMYNPKVSNPQTKPQTMVRQRFGKLSDMCGILAKAINIGFKPASMGNKAFPRAVFMRKNFINVTAADIDDITVDYSSIILSEGSLPEVFFGTPNFTEPLEVRVSFTANNDDPDANTDDDIYLVAYCPDANRAALSLPVKRTAVEVSLTVPAYWSGAKVHLWGFVTKGGELDTMDDVSNTMYIGQGTIS